MKLKKNEKENIIKATELLKRPEYKNQEISDEEKEIKFSWIERTPTEILENISDKDLDEKLLRRLAEQVFNFVKQYPELMRELKEKYFKTL